MSLMMEAVGISETSMMEAIDISETSANFFQTTCGNIPEDRRLHTRRRENLTEYACFVWVLYLALSEEHISKCSETKSSRKCLLAPKKEQCWK
jgi:hypothetical protein